jgi:HAD superfamily hydrolase (TIGR01662 family)
MMSIPAVFLDLNGTLVMPVQVTSPLDYQVLSGSIEAVRLLNQAGFLCPVITVQSRIEKGIYSEQTFLDWILGPYICPHSFKTNCDCHKPKPTLYRQAARDFDIDCNCSYVVGDTLDDIHAGLAIGAQSCFVLTGWASKYVPEFGHEADFIGADILTVAEWIVKKRPC